MTVSHSVTGGLCQQGTGLKAENPNTLYVYKIVPCAHEWLFFKIMAL